MPRFHKDLLKNDVKVKFMSRSYTFPQLYDLVTTTLQARLI